MKQSIILSIFILGIVFSGCIDSINNKKTDINTLTNNATTSKNEQISFISETHNDIINKFYNECDKTLTTIQCKEWLKGYNGKYVKWNGIIYDVTADTVLVDSNGASSGSIALYDIPKEKLLKLNKNDKITFTGKIVINNNEIDNTLTEVLFLSDFVYLKLYDVEIE